MKPCPYCAEQIQDQAIFCRYCQRDLPSHKPPSHPIETRHALIPLLLIVGGALAIVYGSIVLVLLVVVGTRTSSFVLLEIDILILAFGLATIFPRRLPLLILKLLLLLCGVASMSPVIALFSARTGVAIDTAVALFRSVSAGGLMVLYALALNRGVGQGRAWPLLGLYVAGATGAGVVLTFAIAAFGIRSRQVRAQAAEAVSNTGAL